jgi:hypothetical protein
MAVGDDTEVVGQLLDAYASDAWRMGVAAVSPGGAGVPPQMQVGEIDADGWVEWRVLPSTLSETEVAAIEAEFGVQFPPLFRAYLRARFHLFDQVKSLRYDQQVFMTDTPAGEPLKPLRELLSSWRPLTHAGYIPFAEWGDGWGPMCFDAARRDTDGDCPVVWMDHEALVPLGSERCRQREFVAPLAQPLYGSCREFLVDVFGHSQAKRDTDASR